MTKDEARSIERALSTQKYRFASLIIEANDGETGRPHVRVYSFAPLDQVDVAYEDLVEVLCASGLSVNEWSAWCAETGEEERRIRSAYAEPLADYRPVPTHRVATTEQSLTDSFRELHWDFPLDLSGLELKLPDISACELKFPDLNRELPDVPALEMTLDEVSELNLKYWTPTQADSDQSISAGVTVPVEEIEKAA